MYIERVMESWRKRGGKRVLGGMKVQSVCFFSYVLKKNARLIYQQLTKIGGGEENNAYLFDYRHRRCCIPCLPHAPGVVCMEKYAA